jgi:hypothetical protein
MYFIVEMIRPIYWNTNKILLKLEITNIKL